MSKSGGLTVDEAILRLRVSNPDLMFNSYLDEDTRAAADRMRNSSEFREVCSRIGSVAGKFILDLGAGCGIVSYAFCKAGAGRVFALEPDPSNIVGRGALGRLMDGLPCEISAGFGEALPYSDAKFDVVYCRQVLHHTQDLRKVMCECFRVLKPQGVLLCCREHVVDNAEQLAEFLEKHQVHQLAGGENAYSLEEYEEAIKAAGFVNRISLSEVASVINTFPGIVDSKQLRHYLYANLRDRVGPIANFTKMLPDATFYKLIAFPRAGPAGRIYTFQARKPRS